MEIITKGAFIVSISERYDFTGAVSLCARRDKRRGSHRGKVCSPIGDRLHLWRAGAPAGAGRQCKSSASFMLHPVHGSLLGMAAA
jgi:hypothetical protein